MKKKPITNVTAEIDALLNNITDTREDIISKLRNDIICGKYEMNPEKIVESILCHGIYIFRMSKRLHSIIYSKENGIVKNKVTLSESGI